MVIEESIVVKELVKIINTFGVKVKYDNPKVRINPIMKRGESLLYFVPIEGTEKYKYNISIIRVSINLNS